MNRLQISLTEDQYDFLKSESFTTGKSMAAVLRDVIDEVIKTRQQNLLQQDPIWDIIGIGSEIDGPTDVSENVDKYLYGERTEISRIKPLSRVAEEPNEYTVD